MKIMELIYKLQSLPPEAEIVTQIFDHPPKVVDGVQKWKYDYYDPDVHWREDKNKKLKAFIIT